MIEAEVVLCARQAFLDGPAQPGRCGKLGQRGPGAGMGEMTCDGLRITQAPTRQQRPGKTISGLMFERRPGPIAKPWPLGPFAGRHGLPGLWGQLGGHRRGIGLNQRPIFEKPQRMV